MSERIIQKDFRPTKEIKLNISGLTVIAYSSVLVSDLNELTKGSTEERLNLEIVARTIKSWNLFENETAEAPLPITPENLGKLPAPDVTFLLEQIAEFANGQKKN